MRSRILFCSSSTSHQSIVNKGCSWHRKVSINAKIGIGKLIHLPFFCPSLKWEEIILIVVGFRAPLLSRIRCTVAGGSYGKADGFRSSCPNLLFISSSYISCISLGTATMTYATCMYIYIYKLGTRHVVTRRLEPLTESSETIPWSSPDLRILYFVVLTLRFLVCTNWLVLTSGL